MAKQLLLIVLQHSQSLQKLLVPRNNQNFVSKKLKIKLFKLPRCRHLGSIFNLRWLCHVMPACGSHADGKISVYADLPNCATAQVIVLCDYYLSYWFNNYGKSRCDDWPYLKILFEFIIVIFKNIIEVYHATSYNSLLTNEIAELHKSNHSTSFKNLIWRSAQRTIFLYRCKVLSSFKDHFTFNFGKIWQSCFLLQAHQPYQH